MSVPNNAKIKMTQNVTLEGAGSQQADVLEAHGGVGAGRLQLGPALPTARLIWSSRVNSSVVNGQHLNTGRFHP